MSAQETECFTFQERTFEWSMKIFNPKPNWFNSEALIYSEPADIEVDIVPHCKRIPSKVLFLEIFIFNNLDVSLLITYAKCNTL